MGTIALIIPDRFNPKKSKKPFQYMDCNVLLSILVISHNQRELLERCLRSILAQKINGSYEIIISDDNSTDGTWELIENYERLHAGLIWGVRCNSDDCDPANVSERCGWNKLNAYNHCKGQFFVNIDADDYLKSNDIYQKQLDLLIEHPECSMCMQDVWQVNEGDSITNGMRWPIGGKLAGGTILDKADAVSKYRAVNPCYMIRNNTGSNVSELYGKQYDDTIITLHNLQFGSCIYIDRADYVWVRHKGSITSTLAGDDRLVEYALLPLHHIQLIPALAGYFIEAGVSDFIHLLKVLKKNGFSMDLSPKSSVAFKRANGYIYRFLTSEKTTLSGVIKVSYIRAILLVTKKMDIHWPWVYKYIYQLMTSRKRALAVLDSAWRTARTR